MTFAQQIQQAQQADSTWTDISTMNETYGNGTYAGPDHALPTQMRYLSGSETWDWARDTNQVWWEDDFGTSHTIAVGRDRTYTVTFPVGGRDWYWYRTNGGVRERTGFDGNCLHRSRQ